MSGVAFGAKTPLFSEYETNAARWERAKPPARVTKHAAKAVTKTTSTAPRKEAKNMATTNAIRNLTKQVDELKRNRDRREVDALLEQYTNVPAKIVALCKQGNVANARALLNAVTVHSARDARNADKLDPIDRAALDYAMGISAHNAKPFTKTVDGRTAMSHVGTALQKRGR